jgi:hypothetical protein
MTAATDRPRGRRRRWIVALVSVVVIAIGAVIVLVVRLIPDYRTAFLIDTSADQTPANGLTGSFGAVADAVGTAVRNTGHRDALSLRRFGGRCGDPRNTAQVVSSGTRRAAQIDRSVHHLAPSGVATLESGILAAIHDFAGHYPFRGRLSNRIIVVTSHGTDACTNDQAAVDQAVQAKVNAAGLRLDFRFVGYRTPEGEQGGLTQLASAAKAPEPTFVRTTTDLAATLRRLVVPKPHDALPVKVPSPTPAPLADGQHWAYFERVDSQTRIATVDPIQVLWLQAAQKAARQDGAPYAANDYYIRNPSRRTVRLRIATGARITVNRLARLPRPGDNVDISLERFARLENAEPRDGFFIVTVTKGQITTVREQWHP